MSQENRHSCVIARIVPASVVTLAGEKACAGAARSCQSPAAANDGKVAAAIATAWMASFLSAPVDGLALKLRAMVAQQAEEAELPL